MDEFIGVIKLFAGTFAPVGYMFCQGQLLSVTQNAALFAIIGINYGGNGSSNFALPDLRGRIPVGQSQGPGLSSYVLGQMGGVESVTLTTLQLPAHTHFASCNTSPGTQPSPAGAVWAEGPGGRGTQSPSQYAVTPNGTMAPNAISNAGGSQPHENRQPYLALNYIICVQGLFPPRP